MACTHSSENQPDSSWSLFSFQQSVLIFTFLGDCFPSLLKRQVTKQNYQSGSDVWQLGGHACYPKHCSKIPSYSPDRCQLLPRELSLICESIPQCTFHEPTTTTCSLCQTMVGGGQGGLGSNLASYFYIYLLRELMFFEWRAGPRGVVDKCIKH